MFYLLWFCVFLFRLIIPISVYLSFFFIPPSSQNVFQLEQTNMENIKKVFVKGNVPKKNKYVFFLNFLIWLHSLRSLLVVKEQISLSNQYRLCACALLQLAIAYLCWCYCISVWLSLYDFISFTRRYYTFKQRILDSITACGYCSASTVVLLG